MLMKSFLATTSSDINKKSSVFGRYQEKLINTINKFQLLFTVNINQFQ
jgi:hypothetical protein